MKKYILALILLTSFTLCTANAAMIDDFNGGTGIMTVNTDASDVYQAYSSAFGGGRTINISKSGALGATATVNSGLYSHNSDLFTSASSSIIWTDHSGVDLMEGLINNTFLLAISGIDLGSIDLMLSVTDILGGYNAHFLTDIGSGIQPIGFSFFTNVNFHQVKEISLQIKGAESADIQIDSLTTTGTVPTPSILALLSMGLAAFGFSRRLISST